MLKQILKTDKKCLYKFGYNMGIKGARGIQRFQKRIKNGDFFPAFHFISVTDDCNLNCQGCWVTHKKQNARMSPEMLDSIITQSKAKGSYFFGILGGEPLMYKPLFDVFEKHSDCYFQLFTNGTLLTKEVAEHIRKLANVSPLISFEGDNEVADVRRGGKNVYQKAQAQWVLFEDWLGKSPKYAHCRAICNCITFHSFEQIGVATDVFRIRGARLPKQSGSNAR